MTLCINPFFSGVLNVIFHTILEVTLETGPGWVGNRAEERLRGERDLRAPGPTSARSDTGWGQWQVGGMFDLLLKPWMVGQGEQLAEGGTLPSC